MTASNRGQGSKGIAAKMLPVTGSRGQPGAGAQTPGPSVPAGLAAAAVVLFVVSVAALLAYSQAFPRHLWYMLDLRVYLWGGNLVRHAHDPYLYKYPGVGLRFTYPPIAAGFFALMAGIKLWIMKWLITAASIASLVAVLWLTWGAMGYRRSFGRLGATLAVAAVALWMEPVQRVLVFGQVDLMLMLIVIADLCLPDRCWWKGTGVGLAAGFKLTPLIFIPYLLLTRRFRAAAVAAGIFGLTIVGSLLILPKASRHYWFGGLFLNPHLIGRVDRVGNQSLYGALVRLFGTSAAARPYWLVAAAVVGIAGLVLAVSVYRRGQELISILICSLTGLLISPVSWSHHWVWIAPMLVVLASLAVRPPSAAEPRRWQWAGRVGATAMVILFLAYPLHISPGGPRIPAGLLRTAPVPSHGSVMTGSQQVISDLYVLAGLAALCLVAAVLALTRRSEHRRVAGALTDSEALVQPGSTVSG
jgi:glycosyl transferase family 87